MDWEMIHEHDRICRSVSQTMPHQFKGFVVDIGERTEQKLIAFAMELFDGP